MEWFKSLLWSESVAQTMLVYSLIIAVGVALGKIKIFKISLGITFVLFAGIAAGHFGFHLNPKVVDFLRDFGLIIFVFFIGLQVGPSFFSSFMKGGLTMNLLALGVVFLGATTAVVIHFITGTSMSMMVGIMSGAVTNTPGLGAAQQALKQAADAGTAGPDIGLGYAVAYPFGVIGIIFTMLLIRKVFNIEVEKEQANFEKQMVQSETLPEKVNILITNPAVFGCTIADFQHHFVNDAIITRVMHDGEVSAINAETILHENDTILLVANRRDVFILIKLFGKISSLDLEGVPGKLISKQILVTSHKVSGKSLSALNLRAKYGVSVTRIYRAGMDLIATPNFHIQKGDKVVAVGDEKAIESVSNLLGNSIKRLDQPNLIPIFIGILLGVILGSIPIVISGIPTPVKLGLAGGPLIVAILISKFGYRINLSTYTTPSSNLIMRETGIVLFLASVGLKSGEKFIDILVSGDGLTWMLYGAMITVLPILIIGFISKIFLKRNFFEICGLLSGSMTDPPALAFANSIAQSEAPAVTYATVYPMVMFARIIAAQLLVLFFL
ncbi:MAG: putative transporter [Bacteroidetes bacterium]|nr:putative transporter [Bacteroidota bacterium]